MIFVEFEIILSNNELYKFQIPLETSVYKHIKKIQSMDFYYFQCCIKTMNQILDNDFFATSS